MGSDEQPVENFGERLRHKLAFVCFADPVKRKIKRGARAGQMGYYVNNRLMPAGWKPRKGSVQKPPRQPKQTAAQPTPEETSSQEPRGNTQDLYVKKGQPKFRSRQQREWNPRLEPEVAANTSLESPWFEWRGKGKRQIVLSPNKDEEDQMDADLNPKSRWTSKEAVFTHRKKLNKKFAASYAKIREAEANGLDWKEADRLRSLLAKDRKKQMRVVAEAAKSVNAARNKAYPGRRDEIKAKAKWKAMPLGQKVGYLLKRGLGMWSERKTPFFRLPPRTQK